MRSDARHAARQAGGMICCAESGLHFAKEATHWRCVEWPDLLMLPGERYRVGEQGFATLDAALRSVKAGGLASPHRLPEHPSDP